MTDQDVFRELCTEFESTLENSGLVFAKCKFLYFPANKLFVRVGINPLISYLIPAVKAIIYRLLNDRKIYFPKYVKMISPAVDAVYIRNDGRRSCILIAGEIDTVFKITGVQSAHKYRSEIRALTLAARFKLGRCFPVLRLAAESRGYVLLAQSKANDDRPFWSRLKASFYSWQVKLEKRILPILHEFYSAQGFKLIRYSRAELESSLRRLATKSHNVNEERLMYLVHNLPENEVMVSGVHGGLEPGHVIDASQGPTLIDFDGYRDMPVLWDLMWYPLSRSNDKECWDWIVGLENNEIPSKLGTYFKIYQNYLWENFNIGIGEDEFRSQVIQLIFLVVCESHQLDQVRLRWLKLLGLIRARDVHVEHSNK